MELNGLLAKFRGPSGPNSAATPLPSFVLLHGYGSNEDDLFAFERYFHQIRRFSLFVHLCLWSREDVLGFPLILNGRVRNGPTKKKRSNRSFNYLVRWMHCLLLQDAHCFLLFW